MHKVALLLAVMLPAQLPTKQVQVERLATPNDAIGWAIAHQATIPEADRPFYRYIWIPPWIPNQKEEGEIGQWNEVHYGGTMNFVLNAVVSKASLVVPVERHANNFLLAMDFRTFVPDPEEMGKAIELWDSLANDDPYFHATLENSGENKPLLAPHIALEHGEWLAENNASPSLVYRSDWLITKLIDEKYYEFKGWVKEDGSLFTLDEVLAEFGINEKLAKSIQGDQRVAIAISGVTKNTRRIDRIQGAGGRFNTGSAWLTWDVSRRSVNIKNNVFYNLLRFFPEGGEAIIESTNGLHAFVIYNANRQLVREADANLVTDYTIPPGHPAVLTPAISCIRCHGDSEGLLPAPNHVKKLVESGTNILADFVVDGAVSRKDIDQISGAFMGDFDRRLMLGRLDYDEATRRCTIHPTMQAGIGIKDTSSLLSGIYGNYLFEPVTVSQACRELGYHPGKFPVETLNAILPKMNPRNPTIGLLRADIPVRRQDWEQVFSPARYHVIQHMEKEPSDDAVNQK